MERTRRYDYPACIMLRTAGAVIPWQDFGWAVSRLEEVVKFHSIICRLHIHVLINKLCSKTRWDLPPWGRFLLPLIVKFGKIFGPNVGFDSELLPDISVDGAGADRTSGSVAESLDGALACCWEVLESSGEGGALSTGGGDTLATRKWDISTE